jgi:hypothetical protein
MQDAADLRPCRILPCVALTEAGHHLGGVIVPAELADEGVLILAEAADAQLAQLPLRDPVVSGELVDIRDLDGVLDPGAA